MFREQHNKHVVHPKDSPDEISPDVFLAGKSLCFPEMEFLFLFFCCSKKVGRWYLRSLGIWIVDIGFVINYLSICYSCSSSMYILWSVSEKLEWCLEWLKVAKSSNCSLFRIITQICQEFKWWDGKNSKSKFIFSNCGWNWRRRGAKKFRGILKK